MRLEVSGRVAGIISVDPEDFRGDSYDEIYHWLETALTSEYRGAEWDYAELQDEVRRLEAAANGG